MKLWKNTRRIITMRIKTLDIMVKKKCHGNG